MGRYRAQEFDTAEEDEDDETSHSTLRSAAASLSSCHQVVMEESNSSLTRYNGNDGSAYLVEAPMNTDVYASYPTTRNTSGVWVMTLFVVLLACFLANYGPPAPPPNPLGTPQTWSEFLKTEAEKVVSSAQSVGHALSYALSWCMVGLREDILEWRSSFRRWGECWITNRRHICPLMILSSSESIEEWLSVKIIQQPCAVKMVAAALDSWHHNQGSNGRRPLFLLLAGTGGAGKMEMARQVASLLFQHCSTKANHSLDINDGVLVLNGQDFGSHTSDIQSDSFQQQGNSIPDISKLVGRHMERRKGSGAVVIIRHVEKLSPHFYQWLQQVSKEPAKAPVELDNVVFILTTSIGKESIVQHVEKFGSIDSLDTLLSLEREVNAFFGSAENGHLGMMFDAVVPFEPLDRSAITDILRLQIESVPPEPGQHWKRLVVTESASQAISETINFSGDVQDSSHVSFSSVSAKLEKSATMERLKSQFKRCLGESDRYALLDFDTVANQALLCWCNNELTSCAHGSCQELCRFPL